jgi:molybdopterin-guanine dinucleotide biosynthesis protein A
VNDQQQSVYSETFHDNDLVKDDSSLQVGGPLKGILSVHLHLPAEDLLVTACDMPDMQSEVLEQLIAASTTNDAEAFAFRSEEHIEPLSAVYTAGGLQKIHSLYKDGKLNRFSLHHILGVLNTYYLPMPPEWKQYFYNFNTPQDLRGK